MFTRIATTVCTLMLATNVAAQSKVFPTWKYSDDECPVASGTDRYILAPVFHHLEKVAHVERIPGLNVHKDLQKEYERKKMRIYFELFKPWDPNKELLILVPGGPGQTHADFHQMLGEDFKSFANFNVIAMDHRGVGCSRPMFPGNEPPQALLMRQAASDIDLIRKELVGENGKINVWGYSYGSILAQTYALLYPDNLDRLFLGGAFSSKNDFHMAGLRYESLAYSAVTNETRSEFENLTQSAPEVRSQFLKWAFGPLYSYLGRTEEIPAKLNVVIQKLKAGQKAEALNELPNDKFILPLMMRSISCIELFPYEPKYPGEYSLWGDIFASCREFQHIAEYVNYTPLLKQIQAPTLVMGGSFDHVTPAPAMLRIAQEIPNSFIFLDEYVGHSFKGKSSCIDQMTEEFFDGASNDRLEELAYSSICQKRPVFDVDTKTEK